MEIRIGIVQSMKELDVELADDTEHEGLAREIESVIADERVLWLTDRKGRRIGVPAARIAYVEFGLPARDRVVGFGAG